MCGRLDQNEPARNQALAFGWTDAVFDSEAEPRSNAAPGTYRPVLHIENGVRRVDDVFWGYRPAWAAAATPAPGRKKIPIAINARLEKLAGSYWKPLLRTGRGIVCVSGWYEWTGEKGARQPWHIHRTDGKPLFLLVLAHFGPFKHSREESGFVLVTADSMGGMLDIHDRRPIAVSREDAERWMAPELDWEQALHLARTCMLDSSLFSWHPADNLPHPAQAPDMSAMSTPSAPSAQASLWLSDSIRDNDDS